jgi:GT2 family glycosyltransferase
MSKNLPHLAVVILNYNGLNFLKQFLPSVYLSEYSNWDLYVADNASTDKSLDFLASEGFLDYKKAADVSSKVSFGRYFIAMGKNLGFAGGYNAALLQNELKADIYVLLNSDVEVSAGWLQNVVLEMEKNPEMVAAQPKILDYKDKKRFEYAGAGGGFLDKWAYPFCRGRIFREIEQDNGQYDDNCEIFWASGAALFVRKAIFTELGGFDSDYFAHMEEIDLCWRMRLKGGKIGYCGQSVVWHVGGGTLSAENPKKTYLNFRNSLYTILKNERGGLNTFFIIWIRLMLDGLAAIKFLMAGQFANIWAIVKAHWTFFINIPHFIKKRKQIQNTTSLNEVKKYNKSIVFQHFFKKIKEYKEL